MIFVNETAAKAHRHKGPKRSFIGFAKQMKLNNLRKRQLLPAKPPPNKFEGATLYSINNAKLNNKSLIVSG